MASAIGDAASFDNCQKLPSNKIERFHLNCAEATLIVRVASLQFVFAMIYTVILFYLESTIPAA